MRGRRAVVPTVPTAFSAANTQSARPGGHGPTKRGAAVGASVVVWMWALSWHATGARRCLRAAVAEGFLWEYNPLHESSAWASQITTSKLALAPDSQAR